jgi:xanthine dehydrogenase YagT iron-sulfur-binding subunit
MARKRRKEEKRMSVKVPVKGLSRRSFLKTAGVGAVGVAAAGTVTAAEAQEEATPVLKASDLARIELEVNGRKHKLLVEARWSLLHVLREELALTGSKEGCHRGECGACTVLLDGKPRYACLTLAVEAEGAEIVTVEGLLEGEKLGDVQQAFAEKDAFQCGYCTSGQVMAVEGLLRENPVPSMEEIRHGVSGNLCRCGAYPNIFAAAKRAAELKGGAS